METTPYLIFEGKNIGMINQKLSKLVIYRGTENREGIGVKIRVLSSPFHLISPSELSKYIL